MATLPILLAIEVETYDAKREMKGTTMNALEAKAALVAAILKAAKAAIEAGLSEESVVATLDMCKETIENDD